MNKDRIYFGIDILKDVFDVMDSSGNYFQFENDFKGFKKFLKSLSEKSHCVMEATGYYHYKLAYYLIENNIRVSVENPLSVKRFIQMLVTTPTARITYRTFKLFINLINSQLKSEVS